MIHAVRKYQVMITYCRQGSSTTCYKRWGARQWVTQVYQACIVRIVEGLIPLTDWAQNAHSLTVQRGQNAHYVPTATSLYFRFSYISHVHYLTVNLKRGQVMSNCQGGLLGFKFEDDRTFLYRTGL